MNKNFWIVFENSSLDVNQGLDIPIFSTENSEKQWKCPGLGVNLIFLKIRIESPEVVTEIS